MPAEDISRHLFQPDKRYSGVRMQQGRVILDSDWNESEHIQAEQARRILAETICTSGTPNEGFRVQDVKPGETTYNFKLAAGSFYLGGLRFEILGRRLDKFEEFVSQSDWLQIDADEGLPKPPPTEGQDNFRRTDLVYLCAWKQTVTAIEDSELREPALGGPDSSTRQRLMQQIVVLPGVDIASESGMCESASAILKQHITAPKDGDNSGVPHIFDDSTCELRSKATLTVTFEGEGATEDPCQPEAAAGFLGAENQTIRVQLTATNRFIWGYDNASPLYRVQVVEGEPNKISFLTAPRDQAAQPLSGQAVQILRWGALLPNQEKVAELQGHLTTVASSFDPETKTLTLTQPAPQEWIAWFDDPEHSQYLSERDPDGEQKYFYLRLWTGGSGDAQQPDHAFTVDTPVELAGTGLSVTFSANGLPGDYWIIAARPNTPDLVAPWELLKGAPPAGTRFFLAPLALIDWVNSRDRKVVPVIVDCRRKFRPLCEVDGGAADFAHICAINWVHPTPPFDNDLTNITPIKNLNKNGLLIAFDRPVLNGDIHPQSFRVLTSEVVSLEIIGNVVVWCELPIDRVGGVQFARDCEISDFDPIDDPNVAVNGAQFLPKQGFIQLKEYRVLLKGDLIRDAKNGKGLDADHLPPWLSQRPTGDGTEGGTFESWFVTSTGPAPAKVRVEPPDGAQFPQSEFHPPPPAFIDMFFDKRLQGSTVNPNTVRVGRTVILNTGDPAPGFPALDWPGAVTYDDATQTARFTPERLFGAASPDVNTITRYTLTVFGDGGDRILDVDDLALDGNGDGSPGGNRTSTFDVFFIIT